jgi:sugar phosphate isomerase/epimerase
MHKRFLLISTVLLILCASLPFFAQESSPLVEKANLRVIELSGTPYARGRTHGQSLKSEIQELVKRWKADIEKTHSVPAATYIKKLLEASDFKPAIERWTPELLDEVRGIADGAGIDFETMYAFQLIDETWVMSADLGLPKCTTIGAQRRGDSPAVVSQTLDIPEFYHGFQTVLRIKGSAEEPEALVFTIPGVVAANGLNDRSVAVCVNAVTQLAYSTKGLPVDFVIRGILRQKSYQDAVRFLKEIQPAAPQNYVIGGPEEVASFERSASRMVEFIPFEGAEFTYHTNHPLLNDDFNPKFVDGLKKRGMTLEAYKARCPRFKFLGETFRDNTATLDLAALKRVFSDRDSGINNARTYGCTIMVLGDHPELHIAPGRPDTEPFVVLDFGHRTGSPAVSQKSESGRTQIRFGVCDWTIQKGGDPAALELAAKLGLDGVQVSLNPKGDSLALLDKDLQQAYLEAAKKNRVLIASFAIGELNNVPLKSEPRAEKWLAEGIDIAATMNVKIILVPFFGKGDLKNDPAGIEAVVASLQRLAPKAERAGVILALESWLSAEDHLKIITAVGSPAVRVYYDVGNSQEAGYDIVKEIRQLGVQICEFHAKDYKDLYGKGSMDFPAVRAAMEDIGYSGWLVMEGIKLPLGTEESILYDLNYLRGVFAGAQNRRMNL